MVIFRGLGILGLLAFPLGGWLLSTLIGSLFFDGATDRITIATGLFVAAVLLFAWGMWVNVSRPRQRAETGRTGPPPNHHTLFWMPVQWVSLVVVAIGVLVLTGVMRV